MGDVGRTDSSRPGRPVDGYLDGCRNRPAMGRLGEDLLGPSCDLEHQLDLSSVGPPAFPDRRPQPKQFCLWSPRVRRRVAQQPSCLPFLGPLRLTVVANRLRLLVHLRSRPVRPCHKSTDAMLKGKMNKLKLVALAVITLVVVVLVLQNTQSVETKLFFVTLTLPNAALLFGTLIIGFAIGVLTAGHIVSS